MGSHLEPYQNAHELRISSDIKKIHDILNKRQNGWDILSIFNNGSNFVPWYTISPPLPLPPPTQTTLKRDKGREEDIIEVFSLVCLY